MNRLMNAAFLDGTANWTGTAQLTLSVDDETTGAPGRHALIGAGSSSANGQAQYVETAAANRPVVTAGEVLEASAWCVCRRAGVEIAPTAEVRWFNGAGSFLSASPLTVAAPYLTRHGLGRAGIRASFRRAMDRVTAPANAASAALRVATVSTASAQAISLGILKPMLAAPTAGQRDPLVFDPGPHASVDLQLRAWPSDLRGVDVDSRSSPQAWAVEFQGDGRPSRRRDSASPVRRFEGRVRCDPVERAILDAFARTDTDFWFLEPDSDQVCVASFTADGAPRVVEDRGEVSIVSFALWLETA